MKKNTLGIKSVMIIGRRWFRKSAGNTYHTAKVYVDGREVARVPEQYGYGDHFITTALDALEKAGFMPGREHHANGSAEPGWIYFRDDRKIEYTTEVTDVSRERDL